MKDTGSMRIQSARPRLTAKVDLPGQQDRLRQMILYVSAQCERSERFGLTKLNKILWKADFDAYARRRKPITGRAYQRLALGPAPKEMKPLLREMTRDGLLDFVSTDFGAGMIERRPVARASPNLSYFNADDLKYVEAAIRYYWDKTGIETSDDSHGIAWKSRADKDPMFYELSFLSDEQISNRERAELINAVNARRSTLHH